MRNRDNGNGDRGFTLIEILISLTVLIVCVIALVRLYVIAVNASAFTRRATEAISLAESKLELLRTGPAAAGAGQERLDPDGTTFPDAPVFDQTNGFFRREWSAVPNVPAGTVDLSVSVAWIDASGDPRNVTLRARRAP